MLTGAPVRAINPKVHSRASEIAASGSNTARSAAKLASSTSMVISAANPASSGRSRAISRCAAAYTGSQPPRWAVSSPS